MTSEELSPSQAAARIGATTRSVQRWIAAGQLPARRVGGRWRVANDALDAFVATGGPAHQGQGGAERLPSHPPSSLGAVFVANRGEIAVRVTRTCERLGVRAIVPASEGAGALDLLDSAAVVRAALAAGADAVHPGYGFLAESADFAGAVEAAGLRWVGPPPAAIRAMGDKAAARRLAARLGIPVTPGYDGAAQDDATLRRAARRVGYPVLVKPAAGGGGKGMRIVRSSRELAEALAGARREAAAAFGDERVVLERFIEGPRHVEVQVLFDAHGAGVHLGERDCSVQRRHQKVLEETPSPAVGAALREELGGAALRLAATFGYVSAGTCEFLLADDGAWTFLEMNTRLQVEHPVTEAVTGRDLVADQLRIAAGETLAALGFDAGEGASAAGRASAAEGARATGRTPAPGGRTPAAEGSRAAGRASAAEGARATGRTPPPGGHAVEVRLYAEDAEAGFLPATGSVEALRWPTGEGIRVDAGIVVGSVIGPRFDPLLAKIVAHGRDRADAFERLARGLDETVVLGVVTNLRFLRWLVREPWLLAGEARVDSLAAHWHPGAGVAAVPTMSEAAWRAAARALAGGAARTPSPDPWSGAWRLNARPSIALAAPEATRRIELQPPWPGSGTDAVDDLVVDAAGVAHVDVEGRSVEVRIAPPPDVDRAAHAAIAHHAAGRSVVTAPMPGSVVAVRVGLGAEVAAGDPLVVLEAMKMEHVVVAPSPGVVTELAVALGDQVARDQPLATIEA